MNPYQISRFSEVYILPIFAYPLFHIFFKVKIIGKENLNTLKSPFILVSNHITFYDSFIFRLVLSSKHLPIRFMAVRKFDHWYLNFLLYIGLVDLVYLLFGVFIVFKGRGIEKNTEEAVRIINEGGNVVVYPEGEISKDGKLGKFKHGAAVLVKKTGANVLPISMRFGDCKFLRREFIIEIKNVLNFDKDKNRNEITEELYRCIREGTDM